jgi:hypothetical protein
MSRTVRFKLSGRQLEMALQLSNDLKMPLDYTARQALFWAIRKAYDPNYKESQDEAGAAEFAGTDGAASGSEDVSGSALAK